MLHSKRIAGLAYRDAELRKLFRAHCWPFASVGSDKVKVPKVSIATFWPVVCWPRTNGSNAEAAAQHRDGAWMAGMGRL